MGIDTRNPGSLWSRAINAAMLVGFGAIAGLAFSDWWPAQATDLAQATACERVVAADQ
jgi:hypothetical protein